MGLGWELGIWILISKRLNRFWYSGPRGTHWETPATDRFQEVYEWLYWRKWSREFLGLHILLAFLNGPVVQRSLRTWGRQDNFEQFGDSTQFLDLNQPHWVPVSTSSLTWEMELISSVSLVSWFSYSGILCYLIIPTFLHDIPVISQWHSRAFKRPLNPCFLNYESFFLERMVNVKSVQITYLDSFQPCLDYLVQESDCTPVSLRYTLLTWCVISSKLLNIHNPQLFICKTESNNTCPNFWVTVRKKMR